MTKTINGLKLFTIMLLSGFTGVSCSGQISVKDVCSPEWPSGHCEPGYHCDGVKGICLKDIPRCNLLNQGGECEPLNGVPQVCRGGSCVPADKVSALCTEGGTRCDNGQSCQNKVCTPITSENSCSPERPNGLCQDNELCIGGYCYVAEDMVPCDPINHPNGYCPNGQRCTTSGCAAIAPDKVCPNLNESDKCGACECPSWQSCMEGECYFTPPDCTEYGCPIGMTCQNGECKEITPLCSLNNPSGFCADGCNCVNGECVCENITCSPQKKDGYCGGSKICQNGTCIYPECSPNYPNGLCQAGESCQNGACKEAPCSPYIPSGYCADNKEECRLGYCLPALCSTLHPDGYCPDSETYCYEGTCINYTCSKEHPEGLCSVGTICDSDSKSKTFGTCIEGPCSSVNTDGTCPKGQICQEVTSGMYDCVQGNCGNDFPEGACKARGYQCLCRDGSTCTTDPVSCDPPAPDGESCFTCQVPFCGPGTPGGRCPEGLSCQPDLEQEYSCQTPACDANHPTGHCKNNRECVNGTCVATGCKENPSLCDPLSEYCDQAKNQCATADCGDSAPLGDCGIGQACGCAPGREGDCDISKTAAPYCKNGTNCWQCQVPACSQDYPGGSCLDNACTNNNNNQAACDAAPNCHWVAGCTGHAGCLRKTNSAECGNTAGCKWQNCTDIRICAGGECVRPACSAAYPDGACPANSECRGNPRSCQLMDCDATHPQGRCPAGKVCRSGNCVIPGCSSAYPYGACPSGQTCREGVCINLCSLDHDGFCPGNMACVNGLCLTGCTGDADCDGVPDEVEGDNDLDNDGFPNYRDRDSDGDLQSDDFEYDHIYHGHNGQSSTTVCSKLPCDTDGDSTPDMWSQDSDGDYIPDSIEAGPVPLMPLDSDEDGTPDLFDLDSDGDGILDEIEAGDMNIKTPPADTDGDGIPNYLDPDSDGDGIPDTIEARATPHDANSTGELPADHDNDGTPDYLDLDSDGDGVIDAEEDLNGDGIVNCQEDSTGHMIFDSRQGASCTNNDYNPGCRSSSKKPCILRESSRIHTDTDGDGIPDDKDGVFMACGSANIKPIASYYSEDSDYSLAIETDFNKYRSLTISGKEVGATFDAIYTESGANLVAGFIIAKTPDSSVITDLPYGNSPSEEQKIAKAIAQSEKDLASIRAMSNVTAVSEVFKRFTTTFDGYGTIINRYRITRSKQLELKLQRNRIVTALLGVQNQTIEGLDNTSQIGAPDTTFTLLTQTIYRYDNGSNAGRVIILGALVADTNFRSCGSIAEQSACETIPSCVWQSGKCAEFAACGTLTTQSNCNNNSHCRWSETDKACQRKQLPMFYADNITSGSSVGQFGDTLDLMCQTMNQEQGLVDFLWIVDESGSMQQEIDRVKEAGRIFFPLLNNSEADYHVGIATTFLRPDDQDCDTYPPDLKNDITAYNNKQAYLCGHGVENNNDSINAKGDTKHPHCFQNNRPPEGEAGELIGQFTVRKPFSGASECSATNQSGYCYNCGDNPRVPAVGCGNNETFNCPDCAGKTGWIESPYCHFAANLPCDFSYHGHEFGLHMAAWAYEKARMNPDFNAGLSTLPANRRLRKLHPSQGASPDVPVVMVFLSDEEDRFMKTAGDDAADICLNQAKSHTDNTVQGMAGIYNDVRCGSINGKPLHSALADGSDERSCRQQRLADYYNGSDLTVFAIVGPKGTTCALPFDAEQGDGYISIAEATKGGYGSICDENLYPTVEEVIVSSLAVASPYRLQEVVNGANIQPIASTIKVAVESCNSYPGCESGRAVRVTPRSREDGFDYDAQRNKLILYGSGRVKLNGAFTTSYRYWVDNYQPPDGGDTNHCKSGSDIACPETWSHCAQMDKNQTACNNDSSCTYSGGICKTKTCNCEDGKNCDAVSGTCLADPSCRRTCPPSCSGRTTASTCHELAGCRWTNGECKAEISSWDDPCTGLSQSACNNKAACRYDNGQCEMKTWQVCNESLGICECDVTCGGACNESERCDSDPMSATCGQCKCDPTCGGGCGAGAICSTSGATCGQCLCDQTCGGGCDASQNQICDNDLNSATCGLCRPDPTCCAKTGATPGADGDCCDTGYNCDITLGQCVCDTTCGGLCGSGQRCDNRLNSPTCGQCLCDQTCGGSCPQGQCCDDNKGCEGPVTSSECAGTSGCQWVNYEKMTKCESTTCGQCRVDPTCCNCMELPAGATSCCPEGAECDQNTGLCSITVQTCPEAFAWDALRGKCVYIGG